ncbi:hypothetical protein TNCV_897931 [Trichonephila clavipes]|nr:hypothetical protein TNCV_897931 [Trichonephila clavipes]
MASLPFLSPTSLDTEENVIEFLESFDNNTTYYEISANLVCAYLKDHLVDRAHDSSLFLCAWHINGFRATKGGGRVPSVFVYKLLKIQKTLRLEKNDKLLKHIIMRLAYQVIDYVEVRNPTFEAQLLQLVAKRNHENWNQFLKEFAYVIRTAVHETTGKTSAELFLGRKLITPFQKLVLITNGAGLVCGNIEKLFEEKDDAPPRERDEGVVETGGLDGEGSKATHVENEEETEGSKGLAREKNINVEQLRGKRMISDGSSESSNNPQRQHWNKRRPPVRRNWHKRSAPSSFVADSEIKRRPHGSFEKEVSSPSIPSGPGTRMVTRREAATNGKSCSEGPIPVYFEEWKTATDKSCLGGQVHTPAQQIAHQREASGRWKDKSILDKSWRSGNNKEQEGQISVLQLAWGKGADENGFRTEEDSSYNFSTVTKAKDRQVWRCYMVTI